MKRLLVGILIAFFIFPLNIASAQIVQLPTMDKCGGYVAINTAAAGRTQLVALTAGKAIYVCAFSFVAAAAVTVQFDYGTGVACVGSPVALTGAMSMTAYSGMVQTPGTVPVFATAAGNALCINLGGAQQVSGYLIYAIY